MTTKSRTLQTFADCLGELKREKGYTVQQFADTFGAKLNTVRDWLNARVLPRSEALLAIAAHFNVTTDWLLGIEGAPKYRIKNKTAEPSEDVLAARIARGISERFGSEEDVLPGDFDIDLSTLLGWVSEDIARKLRPWIRSERNGLVLNQNAVGLQFLVAELGSQYEKDVPEELRGQYRKVLAHAKRRATRIKELAIVPFLDVPGIDLAERGRRRTRAAMERAEEDELTPEENALSEVNAIRPYRLAQDDPFRAFWGSRALAKRKRATRVGAKGRSRR